MSKVRVAISGFGRIGRLVLRAMSEYDKKGLFEVVAVTRHSASADQMAYLFKYDSVHGRFNGTVTSEGDSIVVNGQKILCVTPENDVYPWKELGVELVIEATGKNVTAEKAGAHIACGAKKVVITAPGKGDGVATFVMGVNEEKYDPAKDHIVSNASCTTNCLAPIAKILNDAFGIEKGLMTTVHSYTGDQNLVDKSHKKSNYRARAAACSMVPTTTGAAKAVALVIPALKGKLSGMALRVPTPDVSIVDLTFVPGRAVTADEVNAAVKKAAAGAMAPYVGYVTDECVSADFIHDDRSSIFAPDQTIEMNGLVKVFAWYDNEWGYSCRCVDLVNYVISKGL
ncbi:MULTISPECIES: type I glyceraldehyde-3-phosphate dehydrogenase [unclassified Pyramidobacter]|uniref:type I glyceraldehyde-3-phosphate dehydrogenase n=1 Tax=unclassified Pyramidobacter TaxID=2632171 RepID=UPI00098EE26E|nr:MULTISPECIES: type I glyceraldehyde-3-phosphate dehydrogenase [unclassified Pyramidobacter]MCI7404383.1 type I glyceraldehyde-3-phosphate dehydrogenase [Pyramidobacter sp.]MDY3212235.1 type I glyceraldehyde-3-phosphate dehydrogenase [Pyramidobacter sp.]OON89674.1 type I glyceraldehyde-3-phosphate dehydrogenase [Pyramidobacter sp. C12-8]RKJ81004.1 type I glyceraldehyde-3-phosphate dehydrogenase [Pyramidobacter sp. CG50-2]WOL39287.1 type I glyceraldehyde-3-phosphate dehydrogenase [Pyramidobac